jgi:hypothetical protein
MSDMDRCLRAADCLARALEAETKAAKAKGLFRTEMLAVAEQWRDLARQALLLSELEERTARENASDLA